MKKLLTTALLVALTPLLFSQNCEINANANPIEITCGQSTVLSAFGSSNGSVILDEDFNSGGFGSGWGSTPGSTNFSNPCSPGGVDGTPHAWMDNNTSVPRTLTSAPYNLSGATAGVTICFDLLFATQGNASPCEGPDEPDEGVFLQYSIDGGATWIDITYFDPNGGNDPQLTNWNNWCFTLPAAALTSNTIIRWHQIADSGADYDHWGIDNVQIFQNDINAEIEWLHDGYSYGVGMPGGNNPTPVTPTSTTTYTAQITTGTGDVCTATVTVVVIDPVYDVTVVANPTTICPGDCATITGTAQIILDPGGIETYENNEFELVASGSSSVNVNVQGINTNSIYAGLIQNVTINGFSFSGSSLCTSFGGCPCGASTVNFGQTCSLTASSFTVTLTSPGGCTIILAPSGVANGNYSNVVFVPVGGTAFNGTFPSAGPWNPQEPFSNLNGCDPNGVWELSFDAPGLGFGIGTLQGWSITFDDPPIYAPVDIAWSPTTGLSNPTSINTDACPLVSTDYVLTVSNGTVGCADHTETVSITVAPCSGCVPPVENITPLTTCAPGTVDLANAIALGSDPATLSYHATQVNAQNDVSPISQIVGTSGSYWIRAEDPSDPLCFEVYEVVVTITPQDNAAFTLTNFCAGSANAASGIVTSGGTFSFNPNLGDGSTINASTGAIANGISGTTYTVQYTTSGTCPSSSTQTVTVTGLTYNASVVDETCGAGNGEINLTPIGGSPSYTYSINGGTTTQGGGSFTSLSSGNYTIQITDNNGCVATGTESVASLGGATIDNIVAVDETCLGACDGTITVTVSGGALPYSYQWFDNGGNPVGTNSATLSAACAGNYSVEVTDAAGGTTQLFFDDFESAAAGWNLTSVQGPEGADPNFFAVNDNEGGVAPGGCGIAGNGDATLHITSVFNSAGGAAYDAGGLCGFLFCPQTNRQAESPLINTVGQTGLTLNFDFIAEGDIPNDQATVWYNDGFGWTQLGTPLFSGTGACAPQGIWTAYSSALPASCENIANLQVAIRWQNNDDGAGSDPSVAINNIEVVTTSAASCTSTDFATIGSPVVADASFTLTDFCAGSTNAASGIVTPGGTFSFSPDLGDGSTINTTTGEITNGVSGTTYTVEYETPGTCPETSTQTVNVTGFTYNAVIVDENCGAGDGEIDLTPVGGSPAYSYSIDGGTTTQAGGSFTALSSGSYNIEITDNNGCVATGTETIASLGAATIDNMVAVDETCLAACDGTITVTVSGGTLPYSYQWFDNGGNPVGTNSATLSAACAGNYSVEVTDGSTCTSTDFATVGSPAPSDATFTLTDFCEGAANGATGIATPGGTFSFNPDLGDGSTINTTTGEITNGILGTTYTVDYETPGACPEKSTETVTVTGLAYGAIIVDENCGAGDGEIALTPIGGSPAYTYSIDDGTTTQAGALFTLLSSGSYSIRITDNNGCFATGTEIVASIGGATIDNVVVVNETCPDECDGSLTVNVSGGTAPYSYEFNGVLNGSNLLSNLCPGIYNYTVTDDNGCAVIGSETITSGAPISATVASVIDDGCSETCDGEIHMTSTTAVAYTLNGVVSAAGNFTNLCAGDYVVIAANASGCFVSIPVTIGTTLPAVASFTFTPNTITVFENQVDFINTSNNSDQYLWQFYGNNGYYDEFTSENVNYTFPADTGSYEVCLSVENTNGCIDRYCTIVTVDDELIVLVPNTFTPDGDEFNQTFKAYVRGVDVYDFSFYIYNRWGEMIWESHDASIGWDGTYHGKLVQEGVYTWQIIVGELASDSRKSFEGHVNVLR